MSASVSSPAPIGVVLIDSLTVVRAGLNLLLANEPDIEVLAEAASADEGFQALGRLRRRTKVVVAVGLELTGAHDTLWLVRSVREQYPSLPVLVTGADVDGALISRALFVGADGFVHKNTSPQKFIDAVRRLAAGEMVLEGLPRGALQGMTESVPALGLTRSTLTPRECEILSLAALGLTARQMGRRLGVQQRTVTTHLGHIYQKLGANGRIAAIAAASRAGLLDPWSPALTTSTPDLASSAAS